MMWILIEFGKESLGYYDLKKHKLWFDEGCSKLLHRKKQAKLQWLQHPSEINGGNLNNIRRGTVQIFGNASNKSKFDSGGN
jgi:hypothetical protein